MKNTIKHLHVLYAGTSFVRLRLQGHPLNLPSEYKASTLRSLRNVTKKTIQNAKLLSNELCFLEKHLEKVRSNQITLVVIFIVIIYITVDLGSFHRNFA
jgi:hypothetical protein